MVAERLPCPGRHDGERIVALEHRTNDFGLAAAEFVEAERLAQRSPHLCKFACDFWNKSAHRSAHVHAFETPLHVRDALGKMSARRVQSVRKRLGDLGVVLAVPVLAPTKRITGYFSSRLNSSDVLGKIKL